MFDTQTWRAGGALASSFLSGCIRFWATYFNRKSSLFPFNVPWRNQICIANCIALPKHLRKTTTQESKKSTSGWGVLFKTTSVQVVLFPSPEPEKKRPQPLN